MDEDRKFNRRSPEPGGSIAVARDYVAEAQLKARRGTSVQSAKLQHRRQTAPTERRVAQQMASLQAETDRVRHSADDRPPAVSNHVACGAAPEGGQVMNRRSPTESEDRSAGSRVAIESPRTGRTAFNPLHPSMELPPEQLLRLLSVEPTTTLQPKREPDRRRLRAAAPPPVSKPPAPPTPKPLRTATTTEQPRPIRPHRNRAAAARTAKRGKRRSLLPAVIVVALVATAAAAFRYWRSDATGKQAPAPPPAATQQSSRAGGAAGPFEQATRRAPARFDAIGSDARKPAEPARNASPPVALQTATGSSQRQDAAEEQRQRLDSDAQRRFAENLRDWQEKSDRPVPTMNDQVSNSTVSAL
jgi:hypothetical protein